MVKFLARTKDGFVVVKGTILNVEGFPPNHTLIGHKSLGQSDSYPYTISHLESGGVFCKVKKKKNAKRAIRKKIESFGTGTKLKRLLTKARKKTEEERWRPKYKR